MIQVKSFTFNPFMENTYVLFDETKEAIIIDPGCYEEQEQKALVSFIENEGLKVVSLVNTHCHIDHVLGNDFVKNHFGVRFVMGKKEVPVLESVKSYAPAYGFQNYVEAKPDDFIDEGDKVKFGSSELETIFVPGHSPGHLAFYNSAQNICIGGDVLFQGSIGRTDLPGGDFDTLIKSIHSKMFPLGDDMVVYPGHGEPTTIAEEKENNPFCALPQ